MGLLVPGHWALAAPQFPTLTGRVVDNAKLLSTSERERLTRLLEQHESKTTNQVVVVTLKSLQGYTIEEFGYQLGRHWGIGQKGKDNGVLLIVASTERKVRIEVGYGLEGTLTDALSRDIIETRILPAFKEDNYEAGIGRGTEGILAVIRGTYQSATPKVRLPSRQTEVGGVSDMLYFLCALVSLSLLIIITVGTLGLFTGLQWSKGGMGSDRILPLWVSSDDEDDDDGGFFGGGGASGGW